jgi:uncharacterized protein DUF4439
MTRLDDLQSWLALEHEAVWLYGLIGARVNGVAKSASTSYDAHRLARDRLIALVDRGGGQPVGPALTYGAGVDTPKDARAAASSVEERIAAACITVFGRADTDGRRFAMSGLRRAALAALDWGAPVRAFPGLD